MYKDVIQKDFYTWICLAWLQNFHTIFPPRVCRRVSSFPGTELPQRIKGFKQAWISLRSTRGRSQRGRWRADAVLPGGESERLNPCMSQAAVGASDVFSAVGAQDVISFCEEASPHQWEGALLTVKTVVMPLPFLKGDVLCATKSC